MRLKHNLAVGLSQKRIDKILTKLNEFGYISAHQEKDIIVIQISDDVNSNTILTIGVIIGTLENQQAI